MVVEEAEISLGLLKGWGDNLGKKPPTMGMSCIHINNISLPQYDAQEIEDMIGYSAIWAYCLSRK
jgi:hypothetical protein